MTVNQLDLGNHVSTHRAAGGFTGFQNRPAGRAFFLTLAGAAVGFIPGLVTFIGGYLGDRRRTADAAA